MRWLSWPVVKPLLLVVVCAVLSSACVSEGGPGAGDSDPVAGTSVEVAEVEVTQAEELVRAEPLPVGRLAPRFATEELPTGETVHCLKGEIVEGSVLNETSTGTRNTRFVEFISDAVSVHTEHDGFLIANTSVGEISLGDLYAELFNVREQRFRATIIEPGIMIDLFEPAQSDPDLWLAIRQCGVSPYPLLLDYLTQAGEEPTLQNATRALLGLQGTAEPDERSSIYDQDSIVAWLEGPVLSLDPE